MVIFNSYVKLPEGMSCLILILALRFLDLPRRFVPLPAGFFQSPHVGSRWFHRLHQLAAGKNRGLKKEGGEAIKIRQNYSGAKICFRLFGSQLVYIDLVNCEEVLVIDVTEITRPEARTVMIPSCDSMFPTCFWCGSNLPRVSCAMLTQVLSTKRSYIDITIISPRVQPGCLESMSAMSNSHTDITCLTHLIKLGYMNKVHSLLVDTSVGQ